MSEGEFKKLIRENYGVSKPLCFAMEDWVDEAQKDLPKIYIDKDGLVSLRDADYDHDIILGQMCREATKNIEEARKSIAKFSKWFGGGDTK